jgi:proline iminopeptidase
MCGPIRLYVREVGAGRPVVVVHGGPDFNHSYLLPELDRLAERFRLIYYDQRGRGRSFVAGAAHELTMRSETEDLECIRRHLDLEAVALLGHSWGALVAMEYALAFPEQVSHLILMNTAPASPHDAANLRERVRAARSAEQSFTISALVSDPRYQAGDIEADAAYYRIHFAAALRRPGSLDVLVARLRRDFTAEGIVAARAIERRLYEQTWDGDDYDLLTRLEQARVPTLVIHGDVDFIPIEHARHIAEAIPDSRLKVLDDCGHFAYLEQPERIDEAITGFLTTTSSPAGTQPAGGSVGGPTAPNP